VNVENYRFYWRLRLPGKEDWGESIAGLIGSVLDCDIKRHGDGAKIKQCVEIRA